MPEELQPQDELQADAALADAAEEAHDAGVPPVSSKNWYIIHTYSGFENKVAESLKTRADAFGFADQIGQILIPTEEVMELRNGKKVTSKRLLYPGYVLVEMDMSDNLWHAVKETPRVTGFVGGGDKPVPLTADEVNSVLYRQASSAERPRPKLTFEKNETVRINDGPFANFTGKVDEVNPERNTLRVMVTIFGRSTPVELDFLQVEKV
jgi:transcriptional antiterminator NusG